jgi:hypothetical protein
MTATRECDGEQNGGDEDGRMLVSPVSSGFFAVIIDDDFECPN